MSEVYIRDELIPKENHSDDIERRTKDEINSILASLIPRPTTSLRQVRLGYTASYPNDKDVNFFFKPEIITKLKDQNLSARLSHNTQSLREVYILNPPQSTHEKLDEHICVELEQRNKLNILYLEKFISLKTNKRYIKVILDSKDAKESLTAKGTVYIYQSKLPARAKIANQIRQGRQTATITTNNQENFHLSQFSSNATTIPTTATWAGIRNTMSHPPPPPQTHSNGPGLLQSPPGLAALQDQSAATNINFYLCVIGTIAERLSYGLENPDIFVSNFNEILSIQGHPPIEVPTTILDSSKSVYMNKNANNLNPTEPLGNTNVHAPKILPHVQTKTHIPPNITLTQNTLSRTAPHLALPIHAPGTTPPPHLPHNANPPQLSPISPHQPQTHPLTLSPPLSTQPDLASATPPPQTPIQDSSPHSPSSPLTHSYTTSLNVNLTLEPTSPAQTFSGPSPTDLSSPLPNNHSPTIFTPLDNFSAVYNTNSSHHDNYPPPPARTPTPPHLPPKAFNFRHFNKDKD